MQGLARVMFAAVAVALAACADINTISRRTSLPGDGKAIHLDAQQRLVIFDKMDKFCAEPSPDAFAAYASSLGLGASVPSQGTASLAQAMQSSAGSIGLRTQSITLMRDALYRMCEAYMKGSLGPAQVAALLARSQDLTAVILAVEQLTGAVAANQVILTGTSGAGASASLLSNNQLLDAAQKDEAAKQKELQEATKERDAAKTAVDTQNAKVAQAQAAFNQATQPNSTVPQDERARLKADLETRKADLEKAEARHSAAEADVKTKEALLAESKRVRETIENARNAALTNAVATTTTSGQFSIPVQRKELSKEATKAIAKSVEAMVKEVLEKDYTDESCMALMTNTPNDLKTEEQKESWKSARTLCVELMIIQAEAKKAKTVATVTKFAPDTSTERIRAALANNPALRDKLRDWLRRNGLEVGTTSFIYGGAYSEQRKRAIRELNIP